MELGKLAGNPRSSPIEKHSDLWKKIFFCVTLCKLLTVCPL